MSLTSTIHKADEAGNAVCIKNLTVAYDSTPVLWDVSLELPRGQLIAVIGPNGAGKSTLLKTIMGLLKPVCGSVVMDGREVGYVPQRESVDWDFPATVLDVVMMGCYKRVGWFRRPGKKEKARALSALDRVGIRELSGRQISRLSGGQQQRVFLARALVQDADVYFMDEPFKGVDTKTEASVIELLKAMKHEGKTILVVHHDLETVAKYFDWVTIINRIVVANGPVGEALCEENIGTAFHSERIFLKEAVI